jgi:hypothetical protein
LEDLCFRRFAFALASLEEVLFRVLKNMVRKQAVYYVLDIPEWCINIWEEHGDVIASQASSDSRCDFICELLKGHEQPRPVTYLADTRTAAASS